jgi:hypothetical protein
LEDVANVFVQLGERRRAKDDLVRCPQPVSLDDGRTNRGVRIGEKHGDLDAVELQGGKPPPTRI